MTTDSKKKTREQRLAEKLRENLRRRKVQAREIVAGDTQGLPKTHDQS